jgi:hypothetical protein
MAHASLSPEGLIATGLRSIGCSHRDFSAIAECLGICVSHSLISMVLRGERSFNPYTAEKLTELLQELLALKSHLRDAPLNWSETEGLSTLLIRRRMEIAMQEVDAAVAAKG